MKTSTMIFNAAGILTLLAVLCAVVNLAQNKTKSMGIVTPPPSSSPVVVSTAPVLASVASVPSAVVTAAPVVAAPVVTAGPYFGYPMAMNTMSLGTGAISQAYPGTNPYAAGPMNPYAVNPLMAYSGTPGVPTVNATNTLGTTMGATPGGPGGM